MNPQFFLLSFVMLILDEDNAHSTNNFDVTFRLTKGAGDLKLVQEIERLEDLEYPGNNQDILQKVQTMWQEYYECLNNERNVEKKPEIHRLSEGQFAEFQCDICPRPFQDYEELEWKYKTLSSHIYMVEPENLDLIPQMTLTADKTLKIFNIVQDFAGLYACYKGRDPVSVYILEVSKNDTMEMINPPQAHDVNILNFEEIDFQIYYKWSDWTECSACGRVGKKMKYGTCTVTISNETINEMETELTSDEFAENVFSKVKPLRNYLKKKLSRNQTSSTETYEHPNWPLNIVENFKNGIPCRSQYLPRDIFESVKQLQAIRVMVTYCRVPCLDTEIFEVIDCAGRVVERANNSAGIYSAFQELPQLPPDIERKTVVAEYEDDIIIQCPGTSLRNIPVTWKINEKIIFPDIIANESKGRFTIDLVNRIHLHKVRLKDTHTYSCWQRNRLVGTVHLNIEKKFKIRYNYRLILIVMLVIIGMVLFVGEKIISRELRSRE